MRTKLVSIIALLSLVSAQTLAVTVDITNDPNRDFFAGYQHVYKRLPNGAVCSVMWAQSRSGHEYLSLPDACKGEGISEEQIYRDAVDKMNEIKASTNFTSFTEYFKHASATGAHAPSNNNLRCLDTMSGTYVFLDAEAHNRPGWFYIDKIQNGGRLSMSIVGYWQETSSGSLVADFGMSTANVNMSNVYAC